jgi:hypothetical protein
MEFALVLRELARRRRVLAIGVLVAAIAAVFSVYHLDGLSLKPRALQYSSASTHVFVDTHSSALGDVSQSFEPLQSRATVYANFMASPTFLNMVGQRVGLAGDEIYAAGPVDPLVPRVIEEPTAVERNVEITGETTPYRLNFNSDPNLPTIGIYGQAPSTKQAIALVNATVASLQQYVASVESEDHVPQQAKIVIRQLGQASGGVVDGGISKAVAAMVFIGVFLLWCILTLLGARFYATWRASGFLSEGDMESELQRETAAQETQLTLRVPTRRTARETADHRTHVASGERAPDVAGSADLHARLRASGS